MEELVSGKVSITVNKWEGIKEPQVDTMAEETEIVDLQAKLQEQKEHSAWMQARVENMKLDNELEHEKLQQEQWEAAMEQLKLAREQMLEEHHKNMEDMKRISQEAVRKPMAQAVAWLQSELQQLDETQKAL